MLRYLQTVAPASEPVDLDEAKDHLRVTSSAEDGYIATLIQKARRYVEQRLSRQLLTATWKAYADEFPDEILLEKLPVAAVSSITYVDTAGATQTLAANQYQVDAASKDRPARVKPAYGCVWPSTRSDTVSAVTVTFTAGYGAASAVPDTIKHAMLLLLSHWYQSREPVSVGVSVAPLPLSVDALLAVEDPGVYV
jgi:uncharacterized phiE125 gp8 family phage protein